MNFSSLFAVAGLFGGLSVGLIALLVVVVLLALAAAALKGKARGGATDVYYLKKTLFSPAERSFLGVLEAVLPVGVRAFGKVRIEDLLGVKSGLDRGARQSAVNRIARKHVDFLLVRGNDLSPLAVIELDDKSHDMEDRRKRDAFVDAAMVGAGLPVLRFPAQQAYLPAEVRDKIAGGLKTREA